MPLILTGRRISPAVKVCRPCLSVCLSLTLPHCISCLSFSCPLCCLVTDGCKQLWVTGLLAWFLSGWLCNSNPITPLPLPLLVCLLHNHWCGALVFPDSFSCCSTQFYYSRLFVRATKDIWKTNMGHISFVYIWYLCFILLIARNENQTYRDLFFNVKRIVRHFGKSACFLSCVIGWAAGPKIPSLNQKLLFLLSFLC